MKRIVSIACALGLGIAAHTSVAAQDFYMPPIIDGSVAVGLAAQSHVQKSEERRAQLTAPSAPSVDGTGSNFDFSFTPDRSRTQQNLQSFVERTKNKSAAADLQQLVTAQPRIIELIGQGIGNYGLDPHDVADVYSVWWISTWLAAQKRNDTPDQGTIDAVRMQVRSAMAATPDFAGTSDAQRQEYAEALLLHTAVMDGAIEEAKNQPATLEKLAAAARRAAKEHGLDLSLMTLTSDGFVPRSSADASGAGDVEEASLAVATQTPDQTDEEGSSLLGVALAAGAGLGLVLIAGGALMRKG